MVPNIFMLFQKQPPSYYWCILIPGQLFSQKKIQFHCPTKLPPPFPNHTNVLPCEQIVSRAIYHQVTSPLGSWQEWRYLAFQACHLERVREEYPCFLGLLPGKGMSPGRHSQCFSGLLTEEGR